MMSDNDCQGPELPDWFVAKLHSVTAKRARTVIDHILEHGHVTTEELRDRYNYDHPPRAARDVREEGIPLETFRVIGTGGRRIGAYRFGDPNALRRGMAGGRRTWPKGFKDRLLQKYGSRCGICSAPFAGRYLQIDHRVPFEVGGDPNDELLAEDFLLVCGSCNRAKSWSCEHCSNLTDTRDAAVCRSCYWASPERHDHIALERIRRLDIVWRDGQVPEYDRLAGLSREARQDLPSFVKDVLRRRR